ncbi:retrovirus-related pol polyprotein from transposon TNT 1-94 [Tanacetum coccineum]|uniref:Retrovirus-related pol polyprotein from transposon TNT 1-94 n=1 Tax=Tanacetum coccineum TaxID=301880 RepID=A0ABQ5A060_9ASTR
MRLIQSLASKELVRNLPKLKFDQHFCDACKIGKQAHASHKAKNIVSTTRCLELLHMDLFGPSAVRSYGGNRYTLVIVDDYSRKVEESLNVTFDETPPPSKTSPLVDDDLDEEEAIKVTEKKNLENDIEDETLEIDEIVNIKESRNHPLENGIDYDETYALVAKLESIKILLAYACALDFKLFQMDVKSAFLNGFINEEVYVAQPPGFIDFEKPDHVYKLKKALYGLKQAPKAWYNRLKAFLIKHEYKMGMVDNTLFTKNKSSNLIIVQIYVDDIIFGSTCQDMCDEFAKIMHDEFEMSMMGELNFFLGLQIKQIEDGGHRDHVSTCLCHMLYCIETSNPYNLAFFILKRMEKTRNKPKELLPYRMLLTRLFKRVVSIFLELAIDHYISYDRVMHPFTPHYERKTRSDHGKKRPRDSNARSSSTTLNHPSSSHPLDDIVDVNDEESFRSNYSSRSQNVSSLSNVVSIVLQNPLHESHHLNTYLSKTIDLQTQHRDDHRKGLRSIGKALKDIMSGKQK